MPVSLLQTQLGTVLVAGLGGVVGGLLVWLLGPLAPTSPLAVPRASASAVVEASRDAHEIGDRVDALEQRAAVGGGAQRTDPGAGRA